MSNHPSAIEQLLAIMTRLRDPNGGCPWDLEQSFSSIVPHTLEEAYEVADAIEREDYDGLKEELGDLLLQVVFHAQMAKEQGLFDFADVAQAINNKLIHRHPHVFGDVTIRNAAEQEQAWDELKKQEKALKVDKSPNHVSSILDDITIGLPALTRAIKIQKKAAKVGFDWPQLKPVFDKVKEELDELYHEVSHKEPLPHRIHDELGDVLFAIGNIARHLNVDPETALRHTNQKFINRFKYIERKLAEQGKTPEQSTLEEMDALWEEAKLKS